MKPITFLLLHLITLAGVISLEFWPNKYVANIMVLFKTLATLQATMIWTLIGTFASKLPSKATINNALEFTRDEKKSGFQLFSRWFTRTIMWITTFVCMAVGQWLLFFSLLAFILGLLKLKGSAANYLKSVNIDFDKKSAVIDV